MPAIALSNGHAVALYTDLVGVLWKVRYKDIRMSELLQSALDVSLERDAATTHILINCAALRKGLSV